MVTNRAVLLAMMTVVGCTAGAPSTSESVGAIDYPIADGQCGYTRAVYGPDNPVPVYGTPVLVGNNCPTEAYVCARPSDEDCGQRAAFFTCGCVPASDVCSPAALAAGLASRDYHTRVDSLARSIECCRGPSLASRGTLADAIDAVLAQRDPPFYDTEGVVGKIEAACTNACVPVRTTYHNGLLGMCDVAEDYCTPPKIAHAYGTENEIIKLPEGGNGSSSITCGCNCIDPFPAPPQPGPGRNVEWDR